MREWISNVIRRYMRLLVLQRNRLLGQRGERFARPQALGFDRLDLNSYGPSGWNDINVATVMIVGIPWYRRKDWDALLEAFDDSHVLHDTYRQWRRSAQRFEKILQRQGHTVERVYIDPVTFPEWCRSQGRKVDAEARSMFASEVAGQRHLEG